MVLGLNELRNQAGGTAWVSGRTTPPASGEVVVDTARTGLLRAVGLTGGGCHRRLPVSRTSGAGGDCQKKQGTSVHSSERASEERAEVEYVVFGLGIKRGPHRGAMGSIGSRTERTGETITVNRLLADPGQARDAPAYPGIGSGGNFPPIEDWLGGGRAKHRFWSPSRAGS